MRVASYNILNGGIGRADPLAEVIEAQRADVVVLVEADDAEVVDRIAKRLNLDVILAPGNNKHGVAVLSRFPIVQTVNHALRWEDGPGSCVEAVVKMPEGIELPVIALHLHPKADVSDEQTRLTQMSRVLGITEPWRQAHRPHLLAGDFNSNSPVQQIDPQRCKASTRESFVRNGNQIPRQVIGQLLELGYVDTLHACDPSASAMQATFTTHEPGQRVDYIFSFGIERSKLKSAWIEHDRLATYASDHYLVGVEIDV